jgi:DNA-directed RNA polymerase subunit omega
MNLPQGIDNIFRFILIVAKRARQLQSGARPLVRIESKRFTRIAQAEVEAGLVQFLIEEPVKLALSR